ncbi:hypothetical protein DV735_g4393, partial [Chaetothyriales sp. CBS 134920]
MAESKKRKAVTRDVEVDAAVASGDEFSFNQLDGSGSEDEFENEDEIFTSGDERSAVSVSDGGSDSDLDEDELLRKKGGLPPTVTRQDEDKEEDDEDQVEDKPNFRVEKDAYGNERYVYDEIDPGDDSEYSVPDAEANTIGNIPLSYYDTFPHIGYTINGKKIMRPATGEALDALLDSIEVPKGWTGLTDPSTGKPLQLSQDELQLLRKIQQNEMPEDGYDPYEPTVEWFTSKTELMPLSAADEPKRRFVPSKHEAKRVMKIVKAIKEGRILPYKAPEEREEDEEQIQNYDIWANEAPRADHAMHMPAPKLPPPGFDQSYHPPPEYLPDDKERAEWEKTEEEDRDKDYLPTDHSSLRKVPGYARFVKEKFERCLDLYLAPRVRRTKLNIDPETLLPKLPDPDELRPFPMRESERYIGHDGRVRSLSVSPSGEYLATGGDDGTVRVWTLSPARQVWMATLESDEAVNVVRWRPGKDASVLAVSAGDNVYLCAPLLEGHHDALSIAGRELLDAGWGYATTTTSSKSSTSITWSRPGSKLQEKGVAIVIRLGYPAKSLSFHGAGNHLVSVCPGTNVPAAQAVAVHTLAKHQTQLPFKRRVKGGGTPQVAHFHPTKPVLYVANQRLIRAYDLSKQSLIKIVQPGARWISSFDVHPTSSSNAGSDNLIVGSYDRRLLWMDLELSPRPYKTLRFHTKAIRAVRFHTSANQYPLFADGSDDGSIQIFHGSVPSDMMSNPQIVPLKVLRGHKVTGGLGVMDLDWHPQHPWLTSGGDVGMMPAVGDQHRLPAPAAAAGNPFDDQQQALNDKRQQVNEYTAVEIARLQSRLDKQLGPEYISSRLGPGGGRVHYLAAEKVIGLANEIFGFNGWSSAIQQIQIDFVDENPSTGKVSLGLSVVVRVTLKDGTYHEDIGYGSVENARGKSMAFEKAKKEGTTDALKRALRNFGNVLGNCIYNKDYVSRITKVKVGTGRWDPDSLHRHRDYEPNREEETVVKVVDQKPPPAVAAPTTGGHDNSTAEIDMGSFDMGDFDDAEFDTDEFAHPDEQHDQSAQNTKRSNIQASPSHAYCTKQQWQRLSYASELGTSTSSHCFYSARAAGKIDQDNNAIHPTEAPKFDPHAQSPSIRKTSGVDHSKSVRLTRSLAVDTDIPRRDEPGPNTAAEFRHR